jgi:murein DD-endopeptidase MepM/ murein hydrolase activator NlpD
MWSGSEEDRGVSALRKYKRAENAFFGRVSGRAKVGLASLSSFFARMGASGRQKLTIMFIPHTEKRIFNLQLSFFALVGLVATVAVVLAAAVFMISRFTDTSSVLKARSQDLSNAQASLDAMRDETGRLVIAARRFEVALTQTVARVGTRPSSPDSAAQRGDLASFFESEATGAGSIREVSEIKKVADYLEQSVDPVNEIGSLLSNQSAVLTSIPNVWPVKGGIGHISMYYGQNENPFSGQWYIHKGIDISTYRTGDPVVATADGKVVTVSFANDFGNYIIIQHNRGFFTRYAHLGSFRVYKGQKVEQGQIIGTIGNTGLTTGPHLHYEIHLGTDVIDPIQFLSIRANVNAQAATAPALANGATYRD